MLLKILFISHKFYPDIGGIEANSEILAHAFVAAGHQVHLLTWSVDPNEQTFPFLIIRKPNYKELIIEFRWADLIFENNPSLRLAWPNLLFRRPSVIALHTWITRSDSKIGWQDRLKFIWLKQAKQVISVSDAIRKRCWPSSIVIANPYQETLFKIHPEIPRIHDFVFLGRLVSDKGADIAIKALSSLLLTENGFIENYTLTIIGEGPERQNLEKQAAELGIDKHITFTGSLRGNKLVDCLNQHRFLLVPSRWEEPFGMVALEGMACGCLPIVSDGGGLPEAIGEAGLAFKRGDVDAFVTCIQRLVENPSFEDQLRQAAKIHLYNHQADKVAQKYLEIFEAALV